MGILIGISGGVEDGGIEIICSWLFIHGTIGSGSIGSCIGLIVIVDIHIRQVVLGVREFFILFIRRFVICRKWLMNKKRERSGKT
jgi:predicted ABC-type sugar transport system permease subunit